MATLYAEKLKDSRWQEKRLHIIDRDGAACRFCGEKPPVLHVHHFQYNGEPWESGDDDLITLCPLCHKEEHAIISAIKDNVLDELKGCGSITYQSLMTILIKAKQGRMPLDSTLRILELCFNLNHNFGETLVQEYIKLVQSTPAREHE